MEFLCHCKTDGHSDVILLNKRHQGSNFHGGERAVPLKAIGLSALLATGEEERRGGGESERAAPSMSTKTSMIAKT